ncbi:MAG: PatB family C-S lyase [Clostridia bacterium]|nr:PatB family C-S lyase [Clostridia bacterium]MBR5365770.1 PatB family C-S lyase [Clostridia bacterium]
MQFDFDTPVNRRGTDSAKWNVHPTELPMWVADMDFKTAPAIERAIMQRAAEGVFGYTTFPDAWYDAYIHWWRDRHDFPIEREWLGFAVGVIPAISTAIRVLSEPGDRVVMLTPIYSAFPAIVEGNGRISAEVQMLRTYEDGRPVYRIDWEALDRALAADHTPLMIFCSPQNPTGQIWDRGTMARIGALCQAHGVTVLSDEIHSDIVMPGKRCLPFAAANEVNLGLTATFLAPTKSFNIMGLKSAAVCAADPGLRGKILSALGDLAGANAFAAPATIAAFTEGGEWLDALCAYIFRNKARVDEFLASELPEIVSVPSEATYLMWLDIGKITGDSGEFYQYLRRETGLYVCPGSWYRGDGARFLRFNAACPRSLLEDGLDRLKTGVRKYEAEHGITP